MLVGIRGYYLFYLIYKGLNILKYGTLRRHGTPSFTIVIWLFRISQPETFCSGQHLVSYYPRHVIFELHFYATGPSWRVNQTSTRGITFVIFQISRHTKICNLHAEKQVIDLVRCSSYLACLLIIH